MTTTRILVVDDEHDILVLLHEILSEEGYRVDTAGTAEEARQALGSGAYDLVLLDIWLPDSDGITLLREWSGHDKTPVIMISGHATIDAALEASRWGAVDVLEKPISLRRLLSAVSRALEMQVRVSPVPAPPPILLDPAWGRSDALHALRQAVSALVRLPLETLLIGEPGSGREEIARALHERTQRHGPFITCAPVDIESPTVFVDRIRAATGGTLCLQDLEGLTTAAQDRLLAWLIALSPEEQSRRFLISTATSELGLRMERHEVTAELLERVGRRVLTVPAVRDYRPDIPELVTTLAERFTAAQALPYRRFSMGALHFLRQQDWPGNLRQLSHVVETVLHEAENEEISPEAVQEVLARRNDIARTPRSVLGEDWLGLPLRDARERFERAYLEELLRRCEGRIGRLAEASGMERTHLYRKLRSLGIHRVNPESDEA